MIKSNNPLVNPLEMYHNDKFPMQKQNPPGLQSKMKPVPDCGEGSYIGNNRLKGRKALITGGDSGIGRAIAIAFVREGAQVAINYLNEEQTDADSLAKLLKDEGRELIMIPGDLRGETNCKKIIEEAHKKLGGLDILIPNAAIQIYQKDIADLSAEQIQKTFDVNVFAPMFLSKAALPLMPEGSSIIFTASAEYYTPNKLLLDYAASKCALVGFGLGLSKQILPKGIRVNSVCPGPIWTPLEISGGNPDEGIPEHGADIPMQRAGQPVEMSGVYVFLASNEASYVTGEIYGVTGGLSAL